nr:MAG TPA: hypothetical protein [Caudoviricetes sp.]
MTAIILRSSRSPDSTPTSLVNLYLQDTFYEHFRSPVSIRYKSTFGEFQESYRLRTYRSRTIIHRFINTLA